MQATRVRTGEISCRALFYLSDLLYLYAQSGTPFCNKGFPAKETRMSILTMKFGGASVGTTAALTQVLSIVLTERERRDNLILVASALDGVTDMLVEAAQLAQLANRRGYRRIVATLRTRHLALVEKLPLGTVERTALQADIDRLLFDMLDTCQMVSDNPSETLSAEIMDRIIGVGEQIAVRIVAALLRQNDLRGVAVDASSLIVTDEVFGSATPIEPLTRERVTRQLMPMLERSIVPVVTGFIGSTPGGKPTTLGRGGSDYTASILGVFSQSDEVWIWTDVDGMMTADPREIPEARVIPDLSYDEVAELAYFGARVLHARMIAPLREHKIALRVKNVFTPQHPGTLIQDLPLGKSASIKAVTSIQGLGLTAVHAGSLAEINILIDEVLRETTGRYGEITISAQSSTQSFLCIIIPTSVGPDAIYGVKNALEKRLLRERLGWQVQPVTVVTAIGAYLNQSPHLLAQIFGVLGETRVLGLAQGPAHCSLSLVVEPHNAERVLNNIHELIISSD